MYAIIQTSDFRFKKVRVENLGDVVLIEEARAFDITAEEAEEEIRGSSGTEGHKNFLLQAFPQKTN